MTEGAPIAAGSPIGRRPPRVWRLLRRGWRSLRRPRPEEIDWRRRRWSIGIYEGASPLALAPARGVRNPVLTPAAVTDLRADLVADPFMIRVDGRWHMFFEVLGWATSRGAIGLATSDDAVTWRYERVVLREPFHLSYPYVFEHGGDHFLLPETYQAGAVRLYRARRFPWEWSFVGEVLRGDDVLVDPSVCHHEGRWWLFVGTGGEGETLRLLSARELRGPWEEHPRSPVVRADRRCSRPAGRVVRWEGGLVRYAQDGVPAYGVAVRAIEIAALDRQRYEERDPEGQLVLSAGGRGWNRYGMHHVDPHAVDGRWIACVDGWSENP